MPSLQQENLTASDTSVHNQQEFEQDLSLFLNTFDLEPRRSEYYWQVGEIKKLQGWIIHLSVIKIQLLELLNTIIPELKKSSIAFKVPISYDIAQGLLDGALGYINLGKIICIYPETDALIVSFVEHLIKLTKQFKGPKIPTDTHLGSIVYTRYGSFNPIRKRRPDGVIEKWIKDSNGNQILDSYSIPFSMPKNIDWPYHSICQSETKTKTGLLNSRYYPVQTIKKDTKGNVIKALYFKNLLKINTCIIKQGKKAMASDDYGRDIQDRLEWQFNIFRDLYNHIPIPTVYDYFCENGDSYLVMEYIKGVTLHQWQQYLYRSRSWLDLDKRQKLLILDLLLQIFSIIQKIHDLGYIHRDITSENILVTQKGEPFLIDLELTWSKKNSYPMPPFGQGTPGFMSPEQIRLEYPTVKEDIYTLGCLMLYLFINISPNKWYLGDIATLRLKLPDLIGDRKISDILCDCLSTEPGDRPTVLEIKELINTYKKQIPATHDAKPQKPKNEVSYEEVDIAIRKGLNGLAVTNLTTSRGQWISMLDRGQTEIGNPQIEATVMVGWHTGICGPMWTIAQANKIGYTTLKCEELFNINWNYLLAHKGDFLNQMNPGLFHGAAGVALMTAEALQSGIMSNEHWILDLINDCLSLEIDHLDLATGASGQGLAILKCMQFLEPGKTQNLLQRSINLLLNTQQSNGTWKSLISHDWQHGHIGIITFLISCQKHAPNPKITSCIYKSLQWLIKSSFDKQEVYKNGYNTEITNNFLGVLRCLISAYDVLKDPRFRSLAETNLLLIPEHYAHFDFTLQTGLTGLGDIYLDAYTVFEDRQWKRRADWIVNFLLLTLQKSAPDVATWMVTQQNQTTADLFSGSSGLLYFLLRWQNPKKVTSILFA